MSVALDFSDMFRQQNAGSSASLAKKRDANNSDSASDLTRAFQFETAKSDENAPPGNSSRDDLRSWVRASLSALNMSGLKDEDLTDASLPVWQKLINDRQYWQQQFQFVSEDGQAVRRRAEAGERTSNGLKSQVEALQQEIISVQNKTAATAEEQRKLRNHWLAEKNDLEKRCFQLQGLNTQYEGTMRKKDKEYDKLQLQLAKLVKDSQRGQKPAITLTKPLPKNLTDQSKIAPAPPTLKDMELADAKATISNLEVENNNLRNMFNTLTQSFEEMQSSMIMTNLSGYMLPPEATVVEESAKAVQCVDAGTDAMPMISNTPCKPAAVAAAATVPSTPRGKPYHLIVKEAITCSKEMRNIALSPPHPSVAKGEQEGAAAAAAADGSEHVLSLQNRVEELMAKLFKAESLIKEQDGLIHAALVAKLPGIDASAASDPETQQEAEESAAASSQLVGSQTPAPEQWDVKDFLSPASPETLALLKASGAFWSPFMTTSTK